MFGSSSLNNTPGIACFIFCPFLLGGREKDRERGKTREEGRGLDETG